MNQQQNPKTKEITKNILMSDLVFAHPKAVEVLTDYGLHCVGCAANSFDTIEMGAKVHGMSDEEINEMMVRVNEAVKFKA